MPSLELQVKQRLDEMGTAFEEFKAANEQRYDELEKLGHVTKETDEKVDKVNAEMNRITDLVADLEKELNRPGSIDDEKTAAQAEHSTAFNSWMRKGRVSDDELEELAVKAAVNVGTADEGGNAVPEELDRDILRQLSEETPMREICQVRPVGTDDYTKLVNTGGTGSGWVGETAARPETTTPNLVKVTPSMGEIYANPAATQKALDDLFFDVETWLAEEVSIEFAEQENAAFTTGNGTDKPLGFLASPNATTDDGARALGTLQYFPTGVSAGFAASDGHEIIFDAVYGIKKGYRNSSRWVLGRNTLNLIRKMKDGDGNLIWRPGLEQGQPDLLAGYALTENEDMPDIAADSLSLAFGDFRRGYLIVDRMGTRTLRDPFTNKPFVHFYTTKRVGGGVIDSNAIKLVKFGTS